MILYTAKFVPNQYKTIGIWKHLLFFKSSQGVLNYSFKEILLFHVGSRFLLFENEGFNKS